ncbi:MAG: hypothetical protein KDC26_03605 [Armatimonadetes bacterium]|nr:hypothetical protein [Armatimonadota bacterium]
MILTPGQNAEFPLKVGENDVVRVLVYSNDFDPGVEIKDEKEQVLISNDDIEPGVQTSRLIYRFTKPGDYKIIVTGYKDAGGGQFRIELERFPCVLAPKGRLNITKHQGTRSFVVPLDKTTPTAITINDHSMSDNTTVYLPNGSQKKIGEFEYHMQFQFEDKFMLPAGDGECFIQIFSLEEGESYIATSPVQFVDIDSIGKADFQSEVSIEDLIIYRFTLPENQISEVDVSSEKERVVALLEESKLDPNESKRLVCDFPGMAKSNTNFVCLPLGKVRFELAVATLAQLPHQKYKLTIKPFSSELRPGQKTQELTLGSKKYYDLQLKAGHVYRITASSQTFDAVLSLYNKSGMFLSRNDDFDSKNSKIEFVPHVSGKHYLQVASYGDGGGGNFDLTVEEVTPNSLGNKVNQALSESELASYMVKEQKGAQFVIRSVLHGALPICKLLLQSGETVEPTVVIEPNGNALFFFTIPEDGEHVLWVEGQEGQTALQLERVKIQSTGGG